MRIGWRRRKSSGRKAAVAAGEEFGSMFDLIDIMVKHLLMWVLHQLIWHVLTWFNMVWHQLVSTGLWVFAGMCSSVFWLFGWLCCWISRSSSQIPFLREVPTWTSQRNEGPAGQMMNEVPLKFWGNHCYPQDSTGRLQKQPLSLTSLELLQMHQHQLEARDMLIQFLVSSLSTMATFWSTVRHANLGSELPGSRGPQKVKRRWNRPVNLKAHYSKSNRTNRHLKKAKLRSGESLLLERPKVWLNWLKTAKANNTAKTPRNNGDTWNNQTHNMLLQNLTPLISLIYWVT